MRKPIHTSVQYGFDTVEELVGVFQGTVKGYNYARQGTPTTAALEAKITQMEKGQGTIVFATGMAGICAIFLTLLKAGDHLVASQFVFGNTNSVLGTLRDLGIQVTTVDATRASAVAEARQAVNDKVKFTPGTYVTWSGQFEYMERAIEKLKVVVPVTLLIIFLLLYLNFRRMTETLIVMLSLPFALVGGIWLMWLLGYNLSVAVAVGFIALAGVAAETGVVMLIYLDHAWEELKAKRRAEGAQPSVADLYEAVMEGAVERVRPKMMTVVAIMAGLLPIMWGTGSGSEVMSRIAAPMVGGMISSTILTLAVIPAIYALVKQWRISRGLES